MFLCKAGAPAETSKAKLREELKGVVPEAFADGGGGVVAGEFGGLAGPHLNFFWVGGFDGGFAHGFGEAALDGIWRRAGSVRGVGGDDVFGGGGASEAAAEGASGDGFVGFGAGEAVGVGRNGFCFWCAKKTGADLNGAGAEDECGGDGASVSDAAGGDDGDVDRVDDLRDEGEEADKLLVGIFSFEGTAVSAGFKSLSDDRVGTCVGGSFGFGDSGGGGEPENLVRF